MKIFFCCIFSKKCYTEIKIKKVINKGILMEIIRKLFELQDIEYKKFTEKLIPTIEPERIIGIRTPVLKKYAKELYKSQEAKEFISEPFHNYYEENNLHSFLIMQIENFTEAIKEINCFLPFIDNWATCDSLRPKAFSKHKKELLFHIDIWLLSEHTYTLRFGIQMLMVHFLDDDFNIKYAEKISLIKSEEYYVNMMIAWYFATALSKQYESILPILSEYKLEKWVHNKTVQKALESNRISKDKKAFLKTLKIK